MRKTLFFILLFTAIQSFAQGDKYKRSAIQHITGTTFVHYHSRLNGVPYYNSDWLNGDVTMKSGEIYHDLQLHYDAYRDDLIYFNEVSKKAIIIDKNAIICFTLKHKNGTEELFEPLQDDNLRSLSGRYLTILLKDSISVIKRCKTEEESYNYITNNGKTGQFIHKETIYAWNGNELTPIPMRRKAIYKQFPEHKEKLRKFIIHNHIKLKNQSDIILLYKEINRLANQKSNIE